MNQISPVKIASREFKANPYPFYAQLRAESPVYPVTLPDKRTAWLITRYEDVAQALKDERFVKNRLNAMTPEQIAKQPWMPGFLRSLERNMLDMDAPDHTRLRGLVHKVFTPRLLEAMRERMHSLTGDYLDAVEARGQMDLIADYALLLPTTIIAEILGVPAEDHGKFHRWSKGIMNASASGWAGILVIPEMIAFLRYIHKLVKMRRASPQDDLITALVQTDENGDQLSEDELVAMIFILLVAGHETTVNLIGNGLLALLRHPNQMAKLRANPELLKSAVEELVRFESPVEMASERYAREDVTIAGTTIPRGELVFAVIASANRDEKQFENADTLDITREPNRHLAFGQGIHYCLGAPLARMEGQIALQTLLNRFPSISLGVPEPMLRWRRGLVLRGLEALPLMVAPEIERERELLPE